MSNKINYYKTVLTPTLNTWAQVYNAGTISSIFSLKNEEDIVSEDISLNAIGKSLINSLEVEYFGLETKNMETIRQALTTVVDKIPSNINSSMAVTCIVGGILYVFIWGQAKILISRNDKKGVLLSGETNILKSASGIIKQNDIIILETNSFSQIIDNDQLFSYIDNNDLENVSEILAPIIHNGNKTDAAILFFKYEDAQEQIITDNNTQTSDLIIPTNTIEPQISYQTYEDTPSKPESDMFFLKSLLNVKKPAIFKSFNHRRRVLFTVFVLLLFVILASVVFSLKREQANKQKTLFDTIYPSALTKYNEGKSLISLDSNTANKDFLASLKILKQNKPLFQKNSSDLQKINNLLTAVNNELAKSSLNNLNKVNPSASPLLNSIIKNPAVTAFTQDQTNIYLADEKNIYEINKTTGNQTVIIKNKNTWQKATALSIYMGNIYLLDNVSNQIFKFINTGGSFSTSDYFHNQVDLSGAQSMAIDSSVWIFSTNNTILEFLSSRPVNFNVSGLKTPFSNSGQIWTDKNTSNLYILDKNNSRIVVLTKNGDFVNQYTSPVIKTASAFDVEEANNLIYILSNKNIYQINLH